MFIHVPPRIVFGDTYAAPWESLIFPNFKDCIKTEALRSWHACQREKEHALDWNYGAVWTWRDLMCGPWACLKGWAFIYADNWLLQPEDKCPALLSAWRREGPTLPHHLPFLETNWEVTPASNVAKTGLWSLVMMSLVLPAGEGRNFWAGEERFFWLSQGWWTHGRNQLTLMEQISWFRMVVPLPFTAMLDSLCESLWPSPLWLNMPVVVFFSFFLKTREFLNI